MRPRHVLAVAELELLQLPNGSRVLPAISIPAGLAEPDSGGPELPVGLQIAGPAFAESGLLDAAHAIEGAIGFQGLSLGGKP